MASFRESFASIPGAVTNFLSETTSSYLNFSTAPSSSHSDESSSDKALTIPASLIKEQWRLIFNSDATISNLEQAISTCKELVLNTDEISDERKWLVRHLVELRYELEGLKEAESDPNEAGPSSKTVIGHHFSVRNVGRSLQNARTYCDHCTGIIWSVVQASYICNDCQYTVHNKCINDIVRVCAHVVVSERKYPISDICPEIGLAAQGYKCAECEAPLNFNITEAMQCWGRGSPKNHENNWVEPRLCDYNGLYYCPSCHWNDVSVTPARIIHNWDFQTRKVCRASLQEINLFMEKPVVKLEEANPKLFVFLQKLSSVKKLRENLCYMRKYLLECRVAIDEKLLDNQIENNWVEPRLCDYNGLYYCPSCHWNDVSVTPARIIHNWDFQTRKVCRASLQEINLFMEKPVVKLEEANPKLFVFLQKLSSVKKLRENLCYMRKYLLECRVAIDEKLLDNQIGSRRHLVQSSEFYSFKDLEQVESSALYAFLNKIFNIFDKHIRSCALCTAKAYICEICSNDEVIYPFDDGCIICDKCKSIYHRVCMTRKNMICPKCTRLTERQLLQTQEIEDAENGN